jgi:hypothetical protein
MISLTRHVHPACRPAIGGARRRIVVARVAVPVSCVHPARLVRAGAGLFATVPPPPGPAIQRYAGKPWPAAGFPE